MFLDVPAGEEWDIYYTLSGFHKFFKNFFNFT